MHSEGSRRVPPNNHRERVTADGTVTVLGQGTFTARDTGPLYANVQTFSVTYNVTLPNTATAPRAEAGEAGSLLLGILQRLCAAIVATSSDAKRRQASLVR